MVLFLAPLSQIVSLLELQAGYADSPGTGELTPTHSLLTVKQLSGEEKQWFRKIGMITVIALLFQLLGMNLFLGWYDTRRSRTRWKKLILMQKDVQEYFEGVKPVQQTLLFLALRLNYQSSNSMGTETTETVGTAVSKEESGTGGHRGDGVPGVARVRAAKQKLMLMFPELGTQRDTQFQKQLQKTLIHWYVEQEFTMVNNWVILDYSLLILMFLFCAILISEQLGTAEELYCLHAFILI